MNVKAKSKAKKSTELLSPVADKARVATFSAYTRALKISSNGVLLVKDGNLVRESLDGSIAVVGKAKPRRKVTVGEIVTVRRVESQSAGCSA